MVFHFMLVTEPQIMGESSWRWIPASPASRLWQFIRSIVYLFSSIIFSVLLLRWAGYEFTECSKQVYEHHKGDATHCMGLTDQQP